MPTESEVLMKQARTFELASVLCSYPDPECERALVALAADQPEHEGGGALARAASGPRGGDDIRSAFLALFDSAQGRASLYETEYGRMRGMAKGTDLADVAGFYQAFGLELDADNAHEMLDHIAVELEFYALLLLKHSHLIALSDAEGCSVVEDARKKFLADHLARLAGALAKSADVRACPVYGDVFAWCWKIVEAECAALRVTPAPLDYFLDAATKDEMKCGAVHLPIMPT